MTAGVAELMRCAVIGTGAMGSALARTLLKSEHPVVVWNRSPERCAPLARQGAQVATSVADAAVAADVIILCLADTDVTADVLASPGVDEAVSGRVLVQFSVGNPEHRTALELWAVQRGASYLAGVIRAYPQEIGTDLAKLNLWGDPAAFGKARAVLDVLGRVAYLGADVRAEEAFAAVGPVLTASLVAVFFEAAAYLEANGVPLERLPEQLGHTYKMALHSATRGVERLAVGVAADSDVEASVDTWVSSVGPLVEAMLNSGIRPRAAEAGLELFRAAQNAGFGACEVEALLRVAGGIDRQSTSC